MEITENTFIEILGLPEWDDKVLDLLDYLELKRPIVEKGEGYAFLKSEEHGVDIMFDYDCITPLQKELEADRNLYVNQISFNLNTDLLLPYHLEASDDYNTVVSKIGREPDAKALGSNTRFRWSFNNKEINYRIIVDFKEEGLHSLKECTLKIEP